MPKTYQQYCPMAHALDLVGERWALLVVRELLRGPLRYTDLADALPGIGTNILASRLRALEAKGIVQKTKLPRPAAVSVYELTDYGRELEEALYALGRWGARSLGPPRESDLLPVGWSGNAVKATFRPEAAMGVDQEFELRFGGEEVVALRVRNGTLDVRCPGTAENPALVVETDARTMFELVDRTCPLAPAEAVRDGRVRIVDGELGTLERFFSFFSFDAAAPTAAASEAA